MRLSLLLPICEWKHTAQPHPQAFSLSREFPKLWTEAMQRIRVTQEVPNYWERERLVICGPTMSFWGLCPELCEVGRLQEQPPEWGFETKSMLTLSPFTSPRRRCKSRVNSINFILTPHKNHFNQHLSPNRNPTLRILTQALEEVGD